MPYTARILNNDEAGRRLRKYPPDVRACVARHVRRLAENPTGLSHRAPSPPYRPGEAQIYEFKCRETTPAYAVVVFFRYSQDETAIVIEAFTFTALGRPRP